LAGLIRDDDSKQKRIDLEIQAIEGERHAIKQEMDNVYALLNHRPDLKYVADKLSELELRLQRLEGQLSEKQNELRALKLTGESFYESKEELRSLIANLQIPDQEHGDLYRLRSQLSARIKALVDALHLAPAGYLETSKQIKFEDMDLNTAFAHVMKIGKDQRYFLVRFTNGDLLGVQPKQHDPLQFDLKAVSAGANGAEITIHDASGNLD